MLYNLNYDIDFNLLKRDADACEYEPFVDPLTETVMPLWLMCRDVQGYGLVVRDFFKDILYTDVKPRFIIQNYGNKPRVQFNSAKNTLRVQAEAGEGNKSIVDIVTIEDGVPLQKWNHIVINYDGGYMDVFLNGNLVGSKPNIAPYMQFDNVVVGENNGIEGGVRNVVYYDRTLTRAEVSLEYKLLGGARRRI